MGLLNGMNFLTHKTSLLEMWFCLRWTWYVCSNLMPRPHRVSWLPFQMLKICPSVHFSCSVMSDSLQPYGLQHARLPCPSPTPRTCSNSCSLSRWCHPTISYSVVPFSSCLQSFPASGSLPMSQFFASGLPKYWSFSFSINPSNEYSGLISFRMYWFDLLAVQQTLESSPTPQFKSINCSVLSFLYTSTLTSILDYWKNHNFD